MTDVARAWLLVVGEYARLARQALAAVAEDAPVDDVSDPDHGSHSPSVWAGASPGATPNVAPSNPIDAQGGHLRTAIGARSHGGPSGWAAPTTHTRSA